MKQLALNQSTRHYDAICRDLILMAERELAAFFGAVTELFGSEQANLSAEDWLHELMAIDDLPASPGQWRRLTVEVRSTACKPSESFLLSTAAQGLSANLVI